MKLYEINQQIAALIDRLDIDYETGEIGEGTDEILKELDALEMERTDILTYLAKLVLNTRSDAAALKAEEQRLKERRQRLEKRDARLMEILDRECHGEKTDLGIATVNYRKTSRVEVSDSAAAVEWLKTNAHDNCYRTPAPEVNKADVKKLLNAGCEVPGTALIEDYSCSLK